MHHISREFCDIRPAGTKPLQHIPEIVENALELRGEIVLADNPTVGRNSKLPRDEVEIAGGDPRRMRIETLGRRGPSSDSPPPSSIGLVGRGARSL